MMLAAPMILDSYQMKRQCVSGSSASGRQPLQYVGGDTLSLIEDWERASLVPKGCWVKTKCDSCGRAILSSLTFTGPNGEDFCSKVCLQNGSEPKTSKVEKKVKEMKMKKAKEVPSKKLKKVSKPEPKENKADKPGKNKSKVEESKKAKKISKPEPTKKSKKSAADEDVERNPNNPYARPSAIVYQIFELALAGTTVKEINKRIAEAGVKPTRVWRELRSGEFKGTKWKYIETEEGKVTVRIRRAKSDE